MKKFKKGFMTAALTGALAAAMVMPAFATQQPESNVVPTSTTADAVLCKDLKNAEGVTFPGETFTFTFTQQDTDTIKTADNAVAIANQTIEIAEGTGELTGTLSLSSFLDSAFADVKAAGEYKYEVREVAPSAAVNGTVTVEGTADSNGKKVDTEETYDTNPYILRVYVKNNDTNTGTVIDKVTVENNGEKKDPTDDDPTNDNGGNGAQPGDTDGFTFVNTYKETITVNKDDPDNPDNPGSGVYGAVGFSKDVEGSYGDQSKEFTFTLTLTKPEELEEQITEDTFAAKKYAKDGSAEDTTVTFGDNTITLKHGEAFGIPTLPAGVKYQITETAEANYEKDGDMNAPEILTKDNAGTNVGVTNTFEDITPTGIVINNFPYILLILVAIAGIAFYETKKRARA